MEDVDEIWTHIQRCSLEHVRLRLSDVLDVDPIAVNALISLLQQHQLRRKNCEVLPPRSLETNEALFSMGLRFLAEQPPDKQQIEVPSRVPSLPMTGIIKLQSLEVGTAPAFLQNLRTAIGTPASQLNEIIAADVVASGDFHKILLPELVDNVLTHAGGTGRLIVAKSRIHASTRISGSSFVATVFRRLQTRFAGQDCLILTIADTGPGVHQHLAEAYRHDPTIRRTRRSRIPDEDVLAYAFEYHSTSRTLADRLGAIKEAISGSPIEFPPPTGLFRIKELLRRYSGVLVIKSGSGTAILDYTALDGLPRLDSKPNAVKHRALLRGTLIGILLPLRGVSPRLTEAISTEPPELGDLYVSLDAMISTVEPLNLESEARLLQRVFAFLDTALIPPGSVVVVDYHGSSVLSAKALTYLTFELAQRQLKGFAIVIMDCDTAVLAEIARSLEPVRNRIRPMLAFDPDLHCTVLGADDDVARTFRLCTASTEMSDADVSVVRQYPNVFAFSKRLNRWTTRLTASGILHTGFRWQSKRVAALVRSAQRAEVKALLPSGVYTAGFYEIAKLLDSNQNAACVERWIELGVRQLKPVVIVTTDKSVAAIVDRIITRTPGTLHARIAAARGQLISNRAPDEIPESVLLSSSTRWLVITEAVASGRTAAQVIGAIQSPSDVSVLALLDSRGEDDPPSPVARVVAALTAPVQRFVELPRTWSAADVLLVDPFTHRLIDRVSGETPLWPELTVQPPDGPRNAFLEQVVIPAAAFHFGHFESGHRHMTVLFDGDRIAERARGTIVELIYKAIDEQLRAVKAEDAPIVVIAPDVGQTSVARDLANHWPGASYRTVSIAELSTPFSGHFEASNTGTAIVFDAVLNSGATTAALIDIAARGGARHVFAVVLVARSSEQHLRQLKNVRRYLNADVTLLVVGHVAAPAETVAACPICADRHAWLRTLDYCRPNSPAFQSISRERRRLDSRPVAEALEVLTASPLRDDYFLRRDALAMEFRWRLASAARAPEHLEVIKGTLAMPESESALAVLTLIARERLHERLPAELRRLLFTPETNKLLRKVLDSWAPQIRSMLPDDLRLYLTATETLTPAALIENLAWWWQVLVGDIAKRELLLLYVARSEFCRAHPSLARDEVQKCKPADEREAELISDIESILDAAAKERRAKDQDRVRSIRALSSQLFHDLRHRLAWLSASVERGEQQAAIEAFYDIEQRVHEIVAEARRVLVPAESQQTRRRATDAIRTITARLGEAERALQAAAVGQTEPSRALLAQSSTLLYESCKSLREHMRTFCVDVQRVIDACVDSWERSHPRAPTLTLQIRVPNDTCYVYCEHVGIRSVVLNLLENAATYANERVFLDVTRDRDAAEVVIEISDDGPGLKDDFEPHDGLRDVAQSVERYCGFVTYESAMKRSGRWQRGWHTTITVRLPEIILPKVQRE